MADGSGDDRSLRIRTILRRLLGGDDQERPAILDEECGSDIDLRLEISELLDLEEQTVEVLDQSVPFRLGSAEFPRPPIGSTHQSGDRIAGYRVVELLGTGGMGEVYLAEAEQPVKRRVALKIIKLGMDTREIVARFESERQALAIMSHPNIARVYDAGRTAAGRPYFVMEHVPGETITEFCDRNDVDVRARLELFMQVCDAVQHAHHKSIIHRDLKPSNVLVMLQDGRPTPKIIDFGISKALDQRLTEKSIYTEMGQMIGTPEYMSPEQAETGSIDIDTRTDIYSLGVLLYELLSGSLPIESENLRQASYAEIQRVIREVDPPRPSTRLSEDFERATDVANQRGTEARALGRQLRGELDWIAMKALEKDRTRRYPSASEFAADIERYLNFEPVVAGPPTALYRITKLCRRHRSALVASGVVLLLLTIIALSTWYVFQSQRRDQSNQARALGDAAAQTYVDKRDELSNLEDQWRQAELLNATHEPVWERDSKLAAWRTWTNALDEVHRSFDDARRRYAGAEKLALEGSSGEEAARLALERLYRERLRESTGSGEIALRPEFFKSMIDSLELGTFDEELSGSKEVIIRTEPDGAAIYCFRYREGEMRLVPLPYSPEAGREGVARGFLGEPYLEVKRLSNELEDPVFRPGDGLLWLYPETFH
jgi:serine/threonine protein kinase